MGENICKQSNWKEIDFQNTQGAHATQYEKNKQSNEKIGRRSKQTFLQRKHTYGQHTHEKILNITNYREVQIKTMMKYYLTVTRMGFITNL